MGTVMAAIVGNRQVSDMTARKGGLTVHRGGAASSFAVKGLIAYDRFPRFVSAGAPSRVKTLLGTSAYSGTTAKVLEFNLHAERARYASAIAVHHAASSFKASQTLSFAEHAAKTEKTPMIADRHLNLAVMLFGQYVAAGFDAPHGVAAIDISHIASAQHQISLAPHH